MVRLIRDFNNIIKTMFFIANYPFQRIRFKNISKKMSVKPSELEENKYGNNSIYKKYCDHNDELWEYENNTKVLIQI